MTPRRSDRVERELHDALNDLLALFWRDTEGLSIRDRCLDALDLRPDLPITVAFRRYRPRVTQR